MKTYKMVFQNQNINLAQYKLIHATSKAFLPYCNNICICYTLEGAYLYKKWLNNSTERKRYVIVTKILLTNVVFSGLSEIR